MVMGRILQDVSTGSFISQDDHSRLSTRATIELVFEQGLPNFPRIEPPVTPAVLPASIAVTPLARHGPSFRRKPESSTHKLWTPACAGVTGLRQSDAASRFERPWVFEMNRGTAIE
jgi:hypothetical protein